MFVRHTPTANWSASGYPHNIPCCSHRTAPHRRQHLVAAQPKKILKLLMRRRTRRYAVSFGYDGSMHGRLALLACVPVCLSACLRVHGSLRCPGASSLFLFGCRGRKRKVMTTLVKRASDDEGRCKVRTRYDGRYIISLILLELRTPPGRSFVNGGAPQLILPTGFWVLPVPVDRGSRVRAL